MDERQKEKSAQCNKQDVLTVTQDLDVCKEVEEDSVDASYVSQAGDDEAQDVKHDIIIHVPPPSSSAQQGTSRMCPSSRDLTTMARRSVGEGEQLAISYFMSA